MQIRQWRERIHRPPALRFERWYRRWRRMSFSILCRLHRIVEKMRCTHAHTHYSEKKRWAWLIWEKEEKFVYSQLILELRLGLATCANVMQYPHAGRCYTFPQTNAACQQTNIEQGIVQIERGINSLSRIACQHRHHTCQSKCANVNSHTCLGSFGYNLAKLYQTKNEVQRT